MNNKLLTIVVLLQVLTLAGQWLGSPNVLPPAAAQIPDAGAQRMAMVDELKALNAKMDKITAILQDGEIKVRVVNDEQSKKD